MLTIILIICNNFIIPVIRNYLVFFNYFEFTFVKKLFSVISDNWWYIEGWVLLSLH